MTLTRRQALRRGALALGVGLAGCASEDAPTDSPTRTPGDGSTTEQPPLSPSATRVNSTPRTPENASTPNPPDDDGPVTTTTTQQGVAWRFDLAADVGTAPTAADGVLYVGGWHETSGTPTPSGDPRGPGTTLRGIDLADGNERLRVDVGAPVQAQPRVVDDRVYVVRGFDGLHGHDYQLRAVATDGQRLWRHEAGSLKFLSVLGVDRAGAVIGENDDNLGEGDEETVALAPDGDVRWRHDTGDIFDGTADTGTVYVTDHRRRVGAFDRTSGERRWTVERDALVRQPTVTDGGLVGLGAVVFALDRSTGDVRWTFDESTPQWLYTDDERAVVPTEAGQLVALDVGDGREVWATERGNRTPVAIGEDAVYVERGDGTLAALDGTTGEALWTADVGERRGVRPAGDRAYVLGDGAVLALAADDGRPLGSVAVTGTPRWVVDGDGRDAVVTDGGTVYGLAL